VNGDLREPQAERARHQQHLHVDREPVCAQRTRHPFQRRPSEPFQPALRVAHANLQQRADERVEQQADEMAPVEEAEQVHRHRITGPVVPAVSDRQVDGRQRAEHAIDRITIVGKVRVGEQHQVAARRREPGPDRAALAGVRQAQDAHVRMRRRKLLRQPRGLVHAAIVDDQDFGAAAEPTIQRRQRSGDSRPFVEAREHDREPRRRLGHRGAASQTA